MDRRQKAKPGFSGRWIRLLRSKNVEVGSAYLVGQVFENHLYGYLINFNIAEPYRKKGSGKKLIEAVKSTAKCEGCQAIAAMMPCEEPLAEWFQHVGFSREGEALIMKL